MDKQLTTFMNKFADAPHLPADWLTWNTFPLAALGLALFAYGCVWLSARRYDAADRRRKDARDRFWAKMGKPK